MPFPVEVVKASAGESSEGGSGEWDAAVEAAPFEGGRLLSLAPLGFRDVGDEILG
jgi:hypothetical protein